MKKYKARVSNRWGCEAKIDEVDVEKETAQSVWIDGRRRAKVSDYETYFDTWGNAHSALMNRQKKQIKNYRLMLQRANSRLNEIKKMDESDMAGAIE